MRKTKNKILTLMLAFIMVFTGMGIGSWGVDTAWADVAPNGWDGTTVSKPSQSEDGIYKISSAAELLWLANAVNSNKDAEAAYSAQLLCDIDLESHDIRIGSFSNPYKWTFDGNGKVIKNLKINDTTTTGGVGLFPQLSASAAVKNLGIVNAQVSSGKVLASALSGNCAGKIESCFVKDSTVSAQAMAGSLCGTLVTNAIMTNCYAVNNNVSGMMSGGLVGNNVGNLSNTYVADTILTTIMTGMIQGNGTGVPLNSFYAKKSGDNNEYKVAKGEEKSIEWLKSDEAIQLLGQAFSKDSSQTNAGYPILKLAGDIDKASLLSVISDAEKIDSTKYHTSNDRWNGSKYSKNGFWADLQAVIEAAKAVYNNENVTQEQVDAAAKSLDRNDSNSALSKAIKNLIPTSQLNATKLYEALRPLYWISIENQATYEELGEHWKVTADNCTQASWTAYMQTREPAEAYLAKLFDKDGNATAFNKAEAAKGDQPGETEADKLADAIDPTQLVNQEKYDTAYQNWKKREAEANSLLVQYDPAKLRKADYTEASWKTYTDTYHALKEIAEYRIVGGTKPDYEMLKGFTRNGYLTDLLVQSYNGLASQGDITVTLQYTNGLAAVYPAVRTSGTDAYCGEVSLTDGKTTVKDAFDKAGIILDTGKKMTGIVPSVAWGATDSAETPYFAVYVDDEFRGVYQTTNKLAQVYLKDGAKVRLNRIVQPLFESEDSTSMTSSAIFRLPADASMYRDSVAVIRIDSMTSDLKVGDKAKLQLSLKDAYGTDSGTQRSAEGITLFVSETPGTTKGEAGQPTRKTTAVTKADGSMEYVFAEEGWYWVAAHNVTPDKYYFQNIYRETTDGIYYSLQCGDAMLVYVSANENESALITSQRNENLAVAKAFYESFHDYDFPAGYYVGDFKIAYENLKTHQNEATTFKALMDSFETDYAALQNCAAQKLDHEARIASLREQLSYVPEDLSTLNDGDKDFIKSVQNAYADLNDYEKNLLTPKELEKLEATAKVDVAKLPVRATVQVKKAYNDSTLPKKNDNGAANYNWPNRAWHLPPNPDGSEPEPKWGFGDGTVSDLPFSAKAGEYVVVRKYLNTTDEQYWMVWTIDNWQTTHLAEAQTLPSRDTNGLIIMWHDGYFLAKYQIPKDIADGSTITFDLKMVNKATYESLAGIAETPEQLAAAKTAALESLKAAYQAYDEANYTPDNWTALTAAYEKGKTDIEAAATSEAAADARKAAIAAMATIAAKGGSENPSVTDYDSGKTVGKVYVSIENNTYPGGNFTGTIAGGWYDLGENDSMMTCVLKALKQAGYSWQGTSGSSKDKNADYGITYLSSIEKDGKSLGEFDGNRKSGWMGTLNDWFVNQGFHAFTVKNGQLENGDEIHVMFTMAYGEDLGGTWNNNSTKLAGLTVSGGTLSPTFSGSQTDYTLIISGDKANVTVKPEAVNKNYQARIFLNRYNQDSARYKRTETISVKSGDILYVGVGESGWPTMNASSVGTKYTIKVVSGSDSAAVDKMLKALKKITYANYKAEKGNVEAARAAYNALDAKGKQKIAAADLKKLTDAEAQIKFYSEIDDAKTKLAVLPKLTNPTQAQANAYRSQINEATAAYKKLSAEQQKYITKADVENYNALAKALGVSTIVGADAAPESPVETTGKTGFATTTSPTEVKVSGTTAAATVKAENQSEILKQAAENKSAEIVLEVAASDTKGAENVQMQLETSFVKNISDKTNASLILDTENGRVSFDQEALKAIISEAKGSTILIEIAKVTKPTEAQKKAAGTNGDIFRLLVKSGDKIISEFNKGKATVRVEIPAKLADKKVAAIYIADDAKIEQLAGKVLTIGGKKFYEFTTPHFSTFALVDAEELGLKVEEPQVDAKALTAKLTPVARSAKTAKKNVKVTTSLDKQDKAIIKELKDAGYTVKYRFYRSTKKAAGYKAAVTKKTSTYTNTSGKKGTKYYYKVQVRVYDANGKLAAKTALKQCKYASRIWTR